MHRQVRIPRLLKILATVVMALALVMPSGLARAATATVTAVAGQVLHRGSNTVTFNVANPGTEAATYTPTVTGPSHFSIVQAAPVTVDGGSSNTISVGVTVPLGTNPATFTLTASVVSGTDTSTASAALPLRLQAGQNRSMPVTIAAGAATASSQQPAEPIGNAFDNNTSTVWHTPWNAQAAPWPATVTIALGAEIDLSGLEVVPRQSGGSNGRWNAYEVSRVNADDSLTKIAEGNMPDTAATKVVPLSGKASKLQISIITSYGDTPSRYASVAEIRVNRIVADDAVPPLPVSLVGTLAAQSGLGAERMFDHDSLTQFHTPYSATQTFPYTIDLALGEDPIDLGSFVMVPYVGAEPGGNNGRPGAYSILAGDSLDSLTEIASGTWADLKTPQTVDLSAAPSTAKFLRLSIGSTYGDITSAPASPQNNKYVAISELKVYGTAVPVITDYLNVSMTRTDTVGATARPGDVLTFDITYANITATAFTAFPRTSNLTGVLTPSTPNCRYENLPANSTKTCTTATHTVTEADATAGTFTPSVSFDATSDRDGATILQAGVAATLPAITVEAAGPAAIGQWVPSTYGQIRIESVSPAKESYIVGDVVTVLLRMESNAAAPKRDITGASATLSNAASCDWKAFPAGVGGKYNCARTGMPPLTYTVTAADAAAGVANFSLTYTETPVNAAGEPNGAAATSTIRGSLPASVPTVETRPEGEYIALASAGDYGFTCHRIPALTEAPNGDLLASWDGRPGGCADAPQANSIIQRRSTDGGQTWGDVTTVAAGKPTPTAEKYGYSDPSYVVDRETGDIFNFFVKSFDQGFQGSQAGTDPEARNVIHAAVTKSEDNGLTWSEPVVITDAITDSASWDSRFAASGEGIQLRYGADKGRLIQQFTIKDAGVYKAMSVFSDDHGLTWDNGTPVGVGMDENKVVELSDGRVMLNSRDSARSGFRKVTYSSDGGETYGPVTLDRTLIDPTNNASIIRAYPEAPMNSAKAKVLLFSNSASQSSRSNGTVRVSFDDGQTWSGSKVFEPGAMSYSTLTPLSEEGTYGLLYEGANTQIRYMTISMDWLGVLPLSITAENQNVNRGANEIEFSATNLAAESVTFTPSIATPSGWTATAVAPVTLAAGASGTFTTTVTVPATADPGASAVTATATIAERSATGTAMLTVVLLPGQNPTQAIPVTPVNTPPAQSGFGIANAFDGNLTTLWHTPYAATVGVPVDVDMKLGDAAVQVSSLEYVPRTTGSNGIINGYEIWGGDSIAGLAKIAEGNFANSNSAKLVPLTGNFQYLRLRAISSYGDTTDKWVSAAEIRVRVAVPDSEVLPLETTLANTLTSQSGFGPEKMFDNNTGTWFHTPYAATQTFPYNIDLALGEESVNVTSVVMTPRLSAAAGDNNGRPGQYKILVGDSLASMTVAASGTWADTAVAKTVEIAATGKFVRLVVDSTYGDGAGNMNRYVAIAELDVFGTVVPAAPKFLEVALSRTDANATPVKVGDELTFEISYTNVSDQTITAYPRESTLTDVLVGDAKNCRWAGLAAGATQVCGFGRHTVTADDLAAGTFTPSVTFDATTDREGTTVLQTGVVATLPAIAVGVVTSPTPTATATVSPSPTATATVSPSPTASPIPTVTVTAPAVTATSTNTATATSSATATTTSTATVTATSTATATVTSSATATSTNTATATSTATATQTVTTTATATATETVTAGPTTAAPTQTATVKPSVKPTVKPTTRPVNVYTDPGYHDVNGRRWFTRCEAYSATQRCFTSIWASQVKSVNGELKWVNGWVFNNLTYLPMDKETWKNNKLAYTNEWTSEEGRQWRTECGTPLTGRNGCRSYILTTVWVPASTTPTGFVQENRWVLNNMLSFS